MFREATSFYVNHIFKILVITVFIVIPVQFLAFYLPAIVSFMHADWGPLLNMVGLVFFLIGLYVSQLPYISLVMQENNQGCIDLKEVFADFIHLVFPVMVAGVLTFFGIALGLTLLIVPGLVLFVVTFMFPYSFSFYRKSWGHSFKQACHFGADKFFYLLAVCSLLIGTLVIGGEIVLFVSAFFLQNTLMVVFSQAIFTGAVLPLFTFWLSYVYDDWNEAGEF